MSEENGVERAGSISPKMGLSIQQLMERHAGDVPIVCPFLQLKHHFSLDLIPYKLPSAAAIQFQNSDIRYRLLKSFRCYLRRFINQKYDRASRNT